MLIDWRNSDGQYAQVVQGEGQCFEFRKYEQKGRHRFLMAETVEGVSELILEGLLIMDDSKA